MTDSRKPRIMRDMLDPMGRMRRIHFVGVGGAGMGGIAEVLVNLGYKVSGSDMQENRTTRRLTKLGVNIFIGHQAEQIQDCNVVVVSTAIKDDNPEVQAAREARIPVIPRAEMLAELMRFRYGIAVAGTHGKTTTTSLVASLLAEGGMDPTFVIGGLLNSAGTHARLGESRYLVAEADESDASFLHLQPMISVVTNIEPDHLATYGGDFERLKETFVEFIHHLPFYGQAVLCLDDPVIRELMPRITRPVITYGTVEDADFRATNVSQHGAISHYRLQLPGQDGAVDMKLNMPGLHNVLNSLAAVVVARELGVAPADIKRGLESFQGIARRFQVHEDVLMGASRIKLIDDYAHHPSELAATIAAARQGWPGQRLLMVFQPHRYSRTADLFDDFVRVLSEVDVLVLTEVYAAGETANHMADGHALARAIRNRGQLDPVMVETPDEAQQLLPGVVQEGDVVLICGAGSIGALVTRLLEQGGV